MLIIPPPTPLTFFLPTARTTRLLVEPSCGAALAFAYGDGAAQLKGEGPLVVVVCGGNMTSLALMQEWRAAFDL